MILTRLLPYLLPYGLVVVCCHLLLFAVTNCVFTVAFIVAGDVFVLSAGMIPFAVYLLSYSLAVLSSCCHLLSFAVTCCVFTVAFTVYGDVFVRSAGTILTCLLSYLLFYVILPTVL
jgi:hypothetical protein